MSSQVDVLLPICWIVNVQHGAITLSERKNQSIQLDHNFYQCEECHDQIRSICFPLFYFGSFIWRLACFRPGLYLRVTLHIIYLLHFISSILSIIYGSVF